MTVPMIILAAGVVLCGVFGQPLMDALASTLTVIL